jgi:1-acyl-sn-glycerol-3-phosphate acyltransferase
MTAGHRALSWAATAVFLPIFGAIFVVFDVAQRVALLFGRRPQEHAAGALQWTLLQSFRICGVRVAVERDPAVARGAAYLFVSNHQSMFDIAILGAILRSHFPKYVSKKSLGKWIPSVSFNLRHGGHVLIDRTDGAAAVEAIRDLGRRVRAGGCSAMIFPEGTRGRRGDLGKFKPAGSLALFEEAPDVPVVPVAIDESWRVLEHNYLPVPFGTRVRVRIGAPIARRPDEDRLALLTRVREEIDATLARWRGGARHARAA